MLGWMKMPRPNRPSCSWIRTALVMNGLSIFLVCGCNRTQVSPPDSAGPATRTPFIAPTPATSTSSVTTSSKPESGWEYAASSDEMTGVVSKIACVDSENILFFQSPYDGGAKGTLCFRKKGKQLNAWLRVNTGQFECGFENCTFRLKFDEDPVQTFAAVEPESHDPKMLFIEPESRLLNSILKAKSVKVEAAFFEEGRRVLTFSVAGLDKSQIS